MPLACLRSDQQQGQFQSGAGASSARAARGPVAECCCCLPGASLYARARSRFVRRVGMSSAEDVSEVGGKLAVERAVALAEQLKASSSANPSAASSPSSAAGNQLDPAAEARRIAQQLLTPDASPIRPTLQRTPPRVPPDVAAAAIAASSPPDSGRPAAAAAGPMVTPVSAPASSAAVAAAAKARAIALSMREEAVASQRDPSPDRNSLQWQPRAVRISGLRDGAAAMNGDYHPERAKGTPANRSMAWRTHHGRVAYFGKGAVLFFDGAASWKLGPELVRKTPLFLSHFYTKNDHFAKTGAGQT